MKKHLGEIYILVGAFLWGCISLTVRPLQEFGFSSIQITVTRSFFTFIFLTIILVIKDKNLFKIKLKDLPVFIGSGLISFLFFNFCYMSSMKENSVSVACMLMYTSPIWVTIFSKFIFKEQINIFKIIALIGALGGCAMVVFSSSISMTLLGLFYGLGSGLGYALYSIFGKIASKNYKPETTSFYTFLIATICGIPICRVWEVPKIMSADYTSIIYFVAIAFFCTVLPYIFYTKGLGIVEAGVASIISITEPIIASIIGLLAYNEKVGVMGICGIAIVVLSLTFLELKGKKIKRKIE